MDEREDSRGGGEEPDTDGVGDSASEDGAPGEGAAAPKLDVPEAHPEGEPTPS